MSAGSQIDAYVEDELKGYMSGEPEELTSKFRDCIRSILSSRRPNEIKESIPYLVRLAVRIVTSEEAHDAH